MSTLQRWRGLKSLIIEGVEHGSRAVERVQRDTAARPFAILEAIPVVAAPARGVHLAHDLSLATVHAVIRGVNEVVSATLDVAFDVAERSERRPP